MDQIIPGTLLSATSICDSDCKFFHQVLERKGNFITAKLDTGEIVRKKIKKSQNGDEYVMLLGTYSMAPAFVPVKTKMKILK